jgi:hypothetical protein
MTLVLEISTLLDSFQLLDQCNPININHDMTILASMIATQFRGRILVHREKCNNSTTPDPFQSARSALARSTPIDALRVVDHQNPTSIGKDTIICVSGNISQVQHVILFVVTNWITPQPFVHFNPPYKHWKIQIMKMQFEYLIFQIRKIMMEIQQFLSTSIRHSSPPSSLFVVINGVTQQLLNGFYPPDFESAADGDSLRLLDCQNPGNIHGDTTILVNFIVGEFEISITTSQYTWQSFKSVSIDKQVTETRSGCI